MNKVKKNVKWIGTITISDYERGQMHIPHICNCDHCGIGRNYKVIPLPLGTIQKQDIGKRVYIFDDIIQVENNEQRDERLSKLKNL